MREKPMRDLAQVDAGALVACWNLIEAERVDGDHVKLVVEVEEGTRGEPMNERVSDIDAFCGTRHRLEWWGERSAHEGGGHVRGGLGQVDRLAGRESRRDLAVGWVSG